MNLNHWGSITTPVYGTSEKGIYRGAELFAGPARLGGSYYRGVLPYVRIVTPDGVSAQVGMGRGSMSLRPASTPWPC